MPHSYYNYFQILCVALYDVAIQFSQHGLANELMGLIYVHKVTRLYTSAIHSRHTKTSLKCDVVCFGPAHNCLRNYPALY